MTLNQLVQLDLATRTYPTQALKDADLARWQNAVCARGQIKPAAAIQLLVPWRNVTNGVVDPGFVAADFADAIAVDVTTPAILEPCELSNLVLYSAGGAVAVELRLGTF
jgi:hypothetical protein